MRAGQFAFSISPQYNIIQQAKHRPKLILKSLNYENICIAQAAEHKVGVQ